jgi:hypothetical protein
MPGYRQGVRLVACGPAGAHAVAPPPAGPEHFLKLRPHGRPLHRADAQQAAPRSVPRSPRTRSCTCARAGIVRNRRSPRARSGRRTWSARPSRRPAPRSSPAPRRTRMPAAARTRVLLHPGKRRHTVDAPCRGASLASAIGARTAVTVCSHRTPRQVAASGKAATTAHGRQRDDRAQNGVRAPQRQPPLSIHAGPVSARFGRRPPAASFPPGPPILGTPLAPSLALGRWNKESPGGKDALAPRAI